MERIKQEDLDMMSLIKSFRNGVKDSFNGVMWLVRYSVANGLKLLLFMAIFAAIAVTIYYVSKPYYRSTLCVSHIRLNNEYCATMVSNLNNYIDHTRENKALAKELKMDITHAREVRSFKYKTHNENIARRYNDSVNVLLPFLIEVEIYDNDVLDTLQYALMNYLEANSYAQVRKDIDAAFLIDAEKQLTSEMHQIDSLKDIVNKSIIPRGSGTGIILGEPVDPVNVYKRGSELYDKRSLIKRRQILNNSFEVLVDFSPSEKKASAGRLIHLAVGLAFGYLVGLIFLLSKRKKPVYA